MKWPQHNVSDLPTLLLAFRPLYHTHYFTKHYFRSDENLTAKNYDNCLEQLVDLAL